MANKSLNSNLHKANKAKKDEFYTQLIDIEKELKKYRKEIQKRGAVDGDLYMITNGIVDVPYARILIKNKKVKK